MRHLVGKSKMGKSGSHRKALLMNITQSLFTHERITTTLRRAKEVRSYAEKMITLAKKGDLASRRQVLTYLHDKSVVKKLFESIQKDYQGRNGGYTRIIHAYARVGDAAPMAILELINAKPIEVKAPEEKKTATAKKSKKAAAQDHDHDHPEHEGHVHPAKR